jgi:hypothetical protein
MPSTAGGVLLDRMRAVIAVNPKPNRFRRTGDKVAIRARFQAGVATKKRLSRQSLCPRTAQGGISPVDLVHRATLSLPTFRATIMQDGLETKQITCRTCYIYNLYKLNVYFGWILHLRAPRATSAQSGSDVVLLKCKITLTKSEI